MVTELFYRRLMGACAMALGLMILSGTISQASTFQSGDDIHISNLHEIDDDYYVFCNKLNIDGTISGDLSAFVYRCEINGELGRSATLFTRTAINSGRIDGSLRVFSERLTQNGQIRGSLISLGSEVELGRSSVIERDVHALGGEVNIDGVINGNLFARCKDIVLSGLIEGDIDIECEKITVTPPLVVRGNFSYKTKEELDLKNIAGVNIIGEITYSEPEKEEHKQGSTFGSITTKSADLLGTFLIGLIAVGFFRRYTSRSVYELQSRVSISLAVGLLGLLVLGFFAMVLLISAVSAGIGSIILADGANAGGILMIGVCLILLPVSLLVSMTGVVLLYVGKIIIALWLGAMLIKRRDSLGKQLLSLLLGLIILSVLYLIPYLGWIVLLAATILGAGAALLGAKNCYRDIPTKSGN